MSPSLPGPRGRATGSAATLVLLCAAMVADSAFDHGRVSASPAEVLLAGATALLVGAWCRPTAALLCVVASAVLLTLSNQLTSPESYTAANDFTFFSVVLAGPVLVGGAWAARTGQIRELRQLSKTRAAQRDRDLALARAQEQNRLTAQVHHGLVQRLGGIVMQAEGAIRAVDATTALDALHTIESSARSALDELRHLLGVLRNVGPPADATRLSAAVEQTTAPRIDRIDLLAASWGFVVAVEAVTSGSARGPAMVNVAVSLIACVPLALRRRRPAATVLALGVPAVAASHWLTPWPAMVTTTVPLLLLAHAIGRYTTGARRLGCCVILVGVVLCVVAASPTESRDADGLPPTMLWTGLAVVAGVAARGHAARVRRLARLLEEIEQSRANERALATAEQRQLLARDLHDSVAHSMTVVCLHATVGQRAVTDPEAVRSAALSVIAETARAGLGELRDGLDDTSAPAPAPLDVEGAIADARHAGLDVRAHLDDAADLPVAVVELAARVVREALVNVTRHAPGARVEVTLARRGEDVLVEVVDSGPPAGDVPAGFEWGSGSGLALLRDRVRAHAGSLDHAALDPAGFRVTARLPLSSSVSA